MDLPKKFEQVALYAADPERTMAGLSAAFGLDHWVHDVATADGFVFGQRVTGVVGELHFNYQLGMELEVLHYTTPHHWHSARAVASSNRDNPWPMPATFMSHVGMHVPDMNIARVPFEQLGWRVAQELWTKSHTNPYLLERGRTYHYLVWDSKPHIGFDLKLIQRIEATKGDKQ